MANSFIGFPVPRAKIADMILSSAPPALHHTQHEKGGADEIDCTGLTGAGGGGATEEPAFEYRSYFDSIDTWTQYTIGGATINLEEDGDVALTTSASNGSYAELRRKFSVPPILLNYDKAIRFKTTVFVGSQDDRYGTVKIACSLPDIDQHIGFIIADGVLKGSCGDGTTEETVTLETIGTGEYFEWRTIEARLDPGNKCEFYVNGIKKGEITSHLPSGESPYSNLIHLSVQNDTHDKVISAFFSYVDFRQYA